MCAQRRLRSAWASAWRKLGSLVTYWVDSEDSDKTWRKPRLIWILAGRRVILLILSCGCSMAGWLWRSQVLLADDLVTSSSSDLLGWRRKIKEPQNRINNETKCHCCWHILKQRPEIDMSTCTVDKLAKVIKLSFKRIDIYPDRYACQLGK